MVLIIAHMNSVKVQWWVKYFTSIKIHFIVCIIISQKLMNNKLLHFEALLYMTLNGKRPRSY